MFTCNKCSREMLFLCFSVQINLRHVFKMFAIGTHACFESWMPLVNGCINCAFFNAMRNVYLHNWKDWVMQQTKYCNNVIMMSVLERRKSTNKNSWNRYCLDMKHIIVNNMNVPLCSWPLVLQDSEATDLRGGGSFKYTFLCRFFLNLSEKNYENWSTFADILPFGAMDAVVMVCRVYCYELEKNRHRQTWRGWYDSSLWYIARHILLLCTSYIPTFTTVIRHRIIIIILINTWLSTGPTNVLVYCVYIL